MKSFLMVAREPCEKLRHQREQRDIARIAAAQTRPAAHQADQFQVLLALAAARGARPPRIARGRCSPRFSPCLACVCRHLLMTKHPLRVSSQGSCNNGRAPAEDIMSDQAHTGPKLQNWTAPSKPPASWSAFCNVATQTLTQGAPSGPTAGRSVRSAPLPRGSCRMLSAWPPTWNRRVSSDWSAAAPATRKGTSAMRPPRAWRRRHTMVIKCMSGLFSTLWESGG